jgi:NAD(P)-dependent dehydrogenase (short-subunit alcohol dehydrogenase family)
VETIADLASAGCVVRALDVTDEGSMSAVVDEIVSAHGAVGSLVNNAGYGEYGPIEEVPIDAWRRQFETNLFGAVRMCQLALPGMRARGGGRIVAVSSMGGRMTLPGGGAYHASKYALEATFDALRFEVRGFGVAVSLVEPGPVATNFTDEAAVSESTGGPYDDFRRTVAAQNARVYANDRVTNTSDQIAAVIEKALTLGPAAGSVPHRRSRPLDGHRPSPSARRRVGRPRAHPSSRRPEQRQGRRTATCASSPSIVKRTLVPTGNCSRRDSGEASVTVNDATGGNAPLAQPAVTVVAAVPGGSPPS